MTDSSPSSRRACLRVRHLSVLQHTTPRRRGQKALHKDAMHGFASHLHKFPCTKPQHWATLPKLQPLRADAALVPMGNHERFYGKLQAHIDQYGWTVICVPGSGYLPAFAYTVGLYKGFGHAEIIMFGFTPKTMHVILNDAGIRIKGGQPIKTGCIYDDFFEGGNVQFLPVDPRNIEDYFGFAIGYNGTAQFPAIEIVWTDRENRFPWESGFDETMRYRQPLLDRNADFKFRELPHLEVYSTWQVLKIGEPILEVVHDPDGNWQFLTGDEEDGDVLTVTLQEIIDRDPSVNELFNLDPSERGVRKAVGTEWRRERYDGTDWWPVGHKP